MSIWAVIVAIDGNEAVSSASDIRSLLALNLREIYRLSHAVLGWEYTVVRLPWVLLPGRNWVELVGIAKPSQLFVTKSCLAEAWRTTHKPNNDIENRYR